MREFIERIILKAGIVHALDLRQLLALAGEPECGLCLTTESDIERIEAEGLHIGHLRCHQSTKISYQFCLHTSGEGQFLTYSFGSWL